MASQVVPVVVITLLTLLASAPSASQTGNDTPVLEPGKPIGRELAGGESHSYRLILAEGQFCYVVVDQRGIDVVVELFDAVGKKLLEVDSPNDRQGPETVSLVADTAGSYRLQVRSVGKECAVRPL